MHSRQSSGVSVMEYVFSDELKKDIDMSDEEKVNIDYGNIFYKTCNGGVIKSVQPPGKNSGAKYVYKVRSFLFLLLFLIV